MQLNFLRLNLFYRSIKQNILSSYLAAFLLSVLIMPLIVFSDTFEYRGAVPPSIKIQTLSGTITIEEIKGGKSDYYLTTLTSIDAAIIPFKDPFVDDFAAVDGTLEPLANCKVLGFYLLDGGGRFWPLQVTDSKGNVILNTKDQMLRLQVKRGVSRVSLIISLLMAIPLWAVLYLVIRSNRRVSPKINGRIS
jgi:hypothetical protein